MFGLVNSPLEQRMFALVWPRIEHLQAAISSNHPISRYPIAIEATAATANLANTAARVETLMFDRIASDKEHYVVGSILKLGVEQAEWSREVVRGDMNTMSNLDTIIRVVHATRLSQYQEECQKGIRWSLQRGNPAWGHGPLAFVAKRWLSDITGRRILREDDLCEEGFDDLPLSSYYFNSICNALLAEMNK
jgi:hypothetical protein